MNKIKFNIGDTLQNLHYPYIVHRLTGHFDKFVEFEAVDKQTYNTGPGNYSNRDWKKIPFYIWILIALPFYLNKIYFRIHKIIDKELGLLPYDTDYLKENILLWSARTFRKMFLPYKNKNGIR